MRGSYEPQEPVVAARSEMEEHISFVLAHPGMSGWLKTALSDALHRDPISVLNDLDILNFILRNRAEICIAEKYNSADPK